MRLHFFISTCALLFVNMLLGETDFALTKTELLQSELVIKRCEALYASVGDARKRLMEEVRLHKSGFFNRFIRKNETYKKRLLHLATFDEHYAQLGQLVNDQAKLKNMDSREEIGRRLEAYSSNCIRFSKGILGFVDWSFGKGPVGFDRIYNDWVHGALRNNKT